MNICFSRKSMIMCKLTQNGLSIFSIHHCSHSDIMNHTQSVGHRSAAKLSASTSKVSCYFQKIVAKEDILAWGAVKNTFWYHSVKHDFSFRSTDFLSKLNELILIPSFLIHVQNEAIVINLLIPLAEENLYTQLRAWFSPHPL